MIHQHFLVRVRDVDAAHRDGDDFRTGRLHRAAVFVVGLVLAGAHDQARFQLSSRNRPAVIVRIAPSSAPIVARGITTADKMHDFQAVAVRDHGFPVSGAGHDFQIMFQRDLARVQA